MAKIDHHVHTSRHSPDSVIDPEVLVERARLAGLDAVVITEHDYQWEADELADLNARADGLVVLSGVEVSAREGHFLVYGLPDLEGVRPRDRPGGPARIVKSEGRGDRRGAPVPLGPGRSTRSSPTARPSTPSNWSATTSRPRPAAGPRPCSRPPDGRRPARATATSPTPSAATTPSSPARSRPSATSSSPSEAASAGPGTAREPGNPAARSINGRIRMHLRVPRGSAPRTRAVDAGAGARVRDTEPRGTHQQAFTSEFDSVQPTTLEPGLCRPRWPCGPTGSRR